MEWDDHGPGYNASSMSEDHGGVYLDTNRLMNPRMPPPELAEAAEAAGFSNTGVSGRSGRSGGSGESGGSGSSGTVSSILGASNSLEKLESCFLEVLLVNVSRSRARRVDWVCEFGRLFSGLVGLGLETRAEFGRG